MATALTSALPTGPKQSRSRTTGTIKNKPAAQGRPKLTPTPFAPHIEARRASYEHLAQLLIGLIEFQWKTDRLDIPENPVLENDPETRNILMDAFDSHMALLFQELQCLEPATINRFYVEMRLHVDQLRYEHEERNRQS